MTKIIDTMKPKEFPDIDWSMPLEHVDGTPLVFLTGLAAPDGEGDFHLIREDGLGFSLDQQKYGKTPLIVRPNGTEWDEDRNVGAVRVRNRRLSPASPKLDITPDGYKPLAAVLDRAFNQAAMGKGAERHAQGQAFDSQPMQHLINLYGLGFALGQVGKKSQEAMRLPSDRAVAELLGVIVYAAGAIIHIEKGAGK